MKGRVIILQRIKNFTKKIAETASNGVDRYDQIMREGAYGKEPNFIKRLLSPTDDVTEPSVHSLIGQKALGGVAGLALKVAVGASAAYVASQVAIGVGVAIVIAGSVKLYKDFQRAKESGREIIECWNNVGQYIRGTRADLCRLNDAHRELKDSKGYVPEASQKSPEEIRAMFLERVADERERVTVLRISNPKASRFVYSLPTVKYDFDFDDRAEYPDGPPKLANMSVAPSWRKYSGVDLNDAIAPGYEATANKPLRPMTVLHLVPAATV